jgi:hypothetical protein
LGVGVVGLSGAAGSTPGFGLLGVGVVGARGGDGVTPGVAGRGVAGMHGITVPEGGRPAMITVSVVRVDPGLEEPPAIPAVPVAPAAPAVPVVPVAAEPSAFPVPVIPVANEP